MINHTQLFQFAMSHVPEEVVELGDREVRCQLENVHVTINAGPRGGVVTTTITIELEPNDRQDDYDDLLAACVAASHQIVTNAICRMCDNDAIRTVIKVDERQRFHETAPYVEVCAAVTRAYDHIPNLEP